MRFLMTLLCALCLSAAAPVALGQSQDNLEKAAELFDQAERFYNLGNWSKAKDLYEQSYLLSNEPAILYNIAQCYRQMGQYEEAIRSYKNFIRQGKLPEGDPQRLAAEKLIKETEELWAKQKSTTTTQPTSEKVEPPKTTPVQPATTVSNEEPPPPTKKKVTPFLLAGGGLFAASLLFGATAREVATSLDQDLNNPDLSEEDIDDVTRNARILAAASDVFLVSSLAVGGVGVLRLVKGKKEVQAMVHLNGAMVQVRF